MKFYVNKDKKGACLFQANERKIIIEDKIYYNTDIISLKVNCNLGKFFPMKKHFDKIDMLVELPPLMQMSGSVTIETTDHTYIFPKVYCVMEAYLIFKRIYNGAEATYTYRNKTLTYRYQGGFNEDHFENDRTFTVVFICDENKGFTENGINKMKDDWSHHCGFRRCKEHENGCFTEYGFFTPDEKWLTFYDDSVEYLNAIGITNQSKIYCKEANGLPVLVISVYEGKAILISYSKEDTNMLYLYDPTGEYYEQLKCDKISISTDYTPLESLTEDKNFSVREIFENCDLSISEKLKKLAYAFNINSYFINCGFYDIISMDPVSMLYFKNGYDIIENRIRLDEKSLTVPVYIMQQGMPAFEITDSDTQLIYGKEFSVSFINIGEGNQGFAFCFSSDEIDKIFVEALKEGEIPFTVEKAEIVLLKDEIDTLEKYESYENTDDMYEAIPVNIDYKPVFGRYAFICEQKDFFIPNGVIVNEDNIKTDTDKKLVEWLLNRHKITIRIVLNSNVILTQPIEFLAMPFANIHRGTAKHIAKLNF